MTNPPCSSQNGDRSVPPPAKPSRRGARARTPATRLEEELVTTYSLKGTGTRCQGSGEGSGTRFHVSPNFLRIAGRKLRRPAHDLIERVVPQVLLAKSPNRLGQHVELVERPHLFKARVKVTKMGLTVGVHLDAHCFFR